MSALEAGRLFTIAATLCVCTLIYLLSRRSAASRGAALIAVLAFAVSPILEPWGFEFRVDMPALAFELGGLYVFSLGFDYWAIGFFLASFFAKPYHFAGIAAVALSCWLAGGRSKSVALLSLWVAMVLLITLILRFAFPYYLLNTLKELAPLYDVHSVVLFPALTLCNNLALFILAAAAIFELSPRTNLAVLFFLVAACQDLLSCLRWGSNLYYLLPTLAAAAILSARSIDTLGRLVAGLPRFRQAWVGATLAFIILAPLYVASALTGAPASIGLSRLAQAGLRCCYISDPQVFDPSALRLLAGIDGPVLTDVPELLLTDERKSLWFMEVFVLPGMRLRGLFDDRPLLTAIRQRRIAAFVLDRELLWRQWGGHDCFWPELREAISDNYYLVDSLGPPYIVLPKGTAAPIPQHGGGDGL